MRLSPTIEGRAGRWLGAAAIAARLAQSAPASAQGSTADRAMAEALFNDGRKLLDQGHVPEACRKLAESQRLDPAPGTLLNLALCHEKEGRLASAWIEWKQAQSQARTSQRPDRVKIATDHIAQLEPRLTTLTVLVPPEADMPGVEVRLDGSVLGKPAWGTASPIDSGMHRLRASAPGRRAWETSLQIDATPGPQTVTIPKLLDEAVPAKEPATPLPLHVEPPPSKTTLQDPGTEAPSSSRGSGTRTAGFVVGGVGLVGLGVGTAFWLRARSLHQDAENSCIGGCGAESEAINDKAKTSSTVGNVSFAAGVVGLGVGVVLLLVSGGGEKSASSSPPALPRFQVGGWADKTQATIGVSAPW